MKILLRQAKILDKQSSHHNKVRDVLVENGMIKSISEKINSTVDKEINAKDHVLSNGFFDLHVNFREPGFEHKEDLKSGCNAAMAGGFTGVLQMPSTNPTIHSKSEIELIRTKTKEELVDVFVAGALSVGLEGKDLSEMYDMFVSGAICFTNDKHAVQDSGLMLRALLYAKNFNALIMSFPNDGFISGKGQMNEGITSTRLGLKGIPSLSEEIMISRDMKLCEYAETGIHFSTISTKASVELIRKAKAKGMKISCDVAAHHLLLDDSHLEEFDTNFKVNPPLRTKEDIQALKEGLKDGTIDAICSDHSPEDIENKRKEFDLASFGASGLETAFAAAYTSLKDTLSLEQIVEKLTIGPRKVLSIYISKIEEGQKANLVLLNPSEEWTVTEKAIRSKSKNNPFIGMKLSGKIKAVVNKGIAEEI